MLNLDITFPETPCTILTLDLVDVTGVHITNVGGKMEKRILDKQGKVLQAIDAYSSHYNEYSSQQVVEHTIQGLTKKEGCQLAGSVQIHKVPGNFHISSHTYQEAYQKLFYAGHQIPMKHIINHLSFGEKEDIKEIQSRYGIYMNTELDGTKIIRDTMRGGQLYVEYVLDLTEAEFQREGAGVDALGHPIKHSGYEYRSMKTILTTHGMGAVWFKYDISPIKVHYTMFYQSFGDFAAHLCAIIGGFFAVAGIFESFVRNGLCLVVPGVKE